ncbi:MAG: hypothetical protein P1S60_13940 [Anaerolineae bacterium]|nr:hypothetical protein [Anaerolineae bacterium]
MMQDHTEPLGKRIGRFILILGLAFAIAAGVIVTQRLSQDSLALLIGLSCGIGAMLPTVGIFILWLRREDTRRDESRRRASQLSPSAQQQPQVIVIAPQALPGYSPGYPGPTQNALPPQWQPAAPERDFKIVGGTD